MSNQTRATTNQMTHKGELLSTHLDSILPPTGVDSINLKDSDGVVWSITVNTQGEVVTTQVG